MSNNKDSVVHQVRIIQTQVFAAIEEANAGVPTERRVTPGSALTAVKRSLSTTRHLPFEVREFQAMRELSAFINLVQKNIFNDTFANHTDLLPVSHPASTRVHGLTASALVEARLRWILSDTRISEQARPLLASVFTSSSDSVEYKYAMTRLTNLPAGSYPLEALVAAFGDGNSAFARRARAMLQRRDRKGRFAFQGGGMSALVERVNGMVQRLTGRVVSQSEDGNNVRIQLPNGRLVDVPVDGGEFIKAVLGKNKDGFSGVEAKHKIGDIIINEEDLQFFDAPHGFRKDTSYTGPGVKFTDDEYDVVKNGKDFAIARRENGQPLGNVDNWADAQEMIYDDEPVADAEAGRKPIARLDQEQIDRMYDPNFDPREILTPAGADLGKGTESDVSAIPGEFEYNYPDGAYQLPQDVKHISGFNDPVNGSSDFTDDPAELAQKFETGALVNALREALLPNQGSKANGEGNLKFNKKEPVPAEAIYLALEEKGVNAKQEVAKIYDAANGDNKNQEALARLEASQTSTPETSEKATLPSVSRNTPEATGTPEVSALEEQPTEPPAAPMRKGQVSPGGDWKWYPPVRMGGNQQMQGHWGMTEKGIAKLPPKEAKTPYVAPEPVLPDEIGGDWKPSNDLDSPDKNPAYEKTIDGVNYKFIQNSDGSWGVVEIRGGQRYGVGTQDDKVDVADPAVFDDKIAQIVDAKQKLNRGALKALLTRWDFNKDVIDLISEADAYEILSAVTADPAYIDLKNKNERFMQGEQNAPYRAESNAFLKINENLDKIKDNYAPSDQTSQAPETPTNEPDIADIVTEVKGGIPTSSEIKAMMEGESIGSQDDISGDAPSEVLPKALQEEKAVNAPEDIQKVVNELDAMEKAIKNDLDELPLFQEEQNRVISALLAVNLAQDEVAKALANLDNRLPFVDAMDAAIWQIGSAIESLTSDEVRMPELTSLKDSLKKLQQQFADAKFKHLESISKDKTPIDDVIKSMLLGGEPDIAVEDLVPSAEVPVEAPVEPPATGRARRVRNNNVAANRRWQARFGIKPPVFYKKNRGMFYDINGVPVNVGDKVRHNSPDKDEKYGEGVIISRIPNLGRWRLGPDGKPVKVDYASYVWVQFANGKKAKLATRMLINDNPDAVENPANVVKPVRDAEMPPPDVYIENWDKFGKALAEFGVEPGKDARGNDGFQADAGNAQQMVISKDADGNYAVYLKEENIWRNRQVEPLFVTKNLPEAANYFIAEVHNRRYGTDFPANPVWMGEKEPSAVPNPETGVVDVPEAGTVSNAGLPNVVNIDTNGKFEDLQKQIQDAIDNGQQIAFNYKGEDRLVTPKRIWTNPKNGNINLDAVGEDGFKVYTIANMENADNPVEATPIPEPTPIPEDVAPQVSDKPFLEKISLEDQMASARAEFMRLGEVLADKAAEGIGPSDPEFAKLDEKRSSLINKMRDFADQIKQRDAVPSRDPQERMDALKSEYKALGNEILDLEISSNPDQNAIDEKRNRMNEIAQEMKDVKVQIDNQKSAPVSEAPPSTTELENAVRQYIKDVTEEFNASSLNAAAGLEMLNLGNVAYVADKKGNQVKISFNKDKQKWEAEGTKTTYFSNIEDAVSQAATDLARTAAKPSNERENVDKFKDFNEYVDNLVNEPEIQQDYDFNTLGGDGIIRVQDKNNKNQANIEWDENAQGYQVNFRPMDLGKEEVFADIQEAGQHAMDILDGNRNKPRPNDQMVKIAEEEFNPAITAPEADEAPASAPSAFVGLGDALYILSPDNAEKHLRDAIADKRNVVFRYKGTDRALTPLSIWTNPKNGNVNLYAEDENGDRKNYTISKIEKVEAPKGAEVAGKPEAVKPEVAKPEVAPAVDESPEIVIPEAPNPGIIGLKTAKGRAKAIAERLKKLPAPNAEELGIEQATIDYYLEKVQELINPTGPDRRRDKGFNQGLDEAIRVIAYFGWYDEMADLTAIRQRKQNLGLRPIDAGLADKIKELKNKFPSYVALKDEIKKALPRRDRGSALEDLRGAVNKIAMYPDLYNYNYRNGVKGAQNAINALLDKEQIKNNPELVAKIKEYGAYIDALADLPEMPKRKPVGAGNAAEAIAGLQGALNDLAGLAYEDLQNGSGDWKYVKTLSAGINKLVLIENRKTGQQVIVKYDNDNNRLINGVNLANGIRAEEMVAQIYRDLGFASPILRQLNPEMTDIEHRGVGIMEFAGDGFLGLENFKVANDAYGVYNNLDMIMPEYQAEILDFLVANGIVGNTDRHRGNFMFGQDPLTGLWRLVPIDNGLALFNGGFNQAENAYPDALALRPDYVIRGRHGNRNGAYNLAKDYIRQVGKDRARTQIEEFAKRMKERAEVLDLIDNRAAGYIGERADWILNNVDKYIDTILGMG